MKKKLLEFYIVGFVLFSDFVLFAQEPGDTSDDPENPLEDPDEPTAPINGKLIWLAILGILFAVSVYRKNRNTENA